MDTNYHIGLKIKTLIEKSGGDMETEAKQLGYTRTGLYKIFKKKDVNTSLLVHFCSRFRVGVDYFFEDLKSFVNEEIPSYQVSKVQSDIKDLQHQLEIKENKISYLSEQNELLRDTIIILKSQKNE